MKKQSFETAIKELENIVDKLESGNNKHDKKPHLKKRKQNDSPEIKRNIILTKRSIIR